MNLKATALSITVLLASAVPMSPQAADKDPVARTERGQLVHDIVMKWGPHVQEAYRVKISSWTTDMRETFARIPIANLREAAAATNFEQMNEVLTGAPTSNAAAVKVVASVEKALGDAANDLVYVPVTPCRILDTRVAGGMIGADSTRHVDVSAVTNFAFQGGDSSNCGIGDAGSFAAVAVNFTVVTPSAAGYITAFPYLGTRPLAATVNYTAGDIRGNLAIVRLDQGASASEMSVYSYAQTHLVADVVGYFTNPQATALQCISTATSNTQVNAGATSNSVAPACPAGYTQTATNCQSSTWQMPFVFFTDGVCSAQNNSAVSATLRASRTCCRVPGR
ncbi:MAG TPA: hypothetical protein PLI48_08915 [Gammaproteobacteria bacterium]|nr:hypothetical protein [Gammaproteobacteria bacterium]